MTSNAIRDLPHDPLASIGMPVHNGAEYLTGAIEAVLAQTWRHLELIIVDNASEDGSLEIAKRFAAQDDRVRIIGSRVNRGAAWSHNETFRRANGPLFRWASHDDLTTEDHLERCVEAMLTEPRVPLVRPRAMEIDEQGRALFVHDDEISVSSSDPAARFEEALRRPHGCMDVYGLMRSDVLSKTGLIGPYPASDRVLLGELALYGPWTRIQEPLFLHRQHLDRSVRRFPGRRERAVWFDPSVAGRRFVFPDWRKLAGYLTAIRKAPLSPQQRRRCHLVLARWATGELRPLAGDVRRAFEPMPGRSIG